MVHFKDCGRCGQLEAREKTQDTLVLLNGYETWKITSNIVLVLKRTFEFDACETGYILFSRKFFI